MKIQDKIKRQQQKRRRDLHKLVEAKLQALLEVALQLSKNKKND